MLVLPKKGIPLGQTKCATHCVTLQLLKALDVSGAAFNHHQFTILLWMMSLRVGELSLSRLQKET